MRANMSDPQTVRFECDTSSVNWQDLLSLFKLAKLGGPPVRVTMNGYSISLIEGEYLVEREGLEVPS